VKGSNCGTVFTFEGLNVIKISQQYIFIYNLQTKILTQDLSNTK